MAMSTGAKVAIGCGAVVVIAGAIGAAAVVGGAIWVKGKADTFVARAQKMEKLKEQAQANPFTLPGDGAMSEDRLVAYIAVRKGQVEYLLAHQDEIEKLHADTKDPKKSPSLGDVTSSVSILAGIEETL
ncbi:MAG TPA: hypothetical protein VMV18_15770, partial [bacterium]|nr:hypothetical protein [bacterium]